MITPDPVRSCYYPLTEGSNWLYVPKEIGTDMIDTGYVKSLEKITIVSDSVIQGKKYNRALTELFDVSALPYPQHKFFEGFGFNSLIRTSGDSLIVRLWNSDLKISGCTIVENEILHLLFSERFKDIIEGVGNFHNLDVCGTYRYRSMVVRHHLEFSNSYHKFKDVFEVEMDLFDNNDTVSVEKYWFANNVGVVRKLVNSKTWPGLYYDLSEWEIKAK